jgi:peptide/nickel transport system ATP-binding protein
MPDRPEPVLSVRNLRIETSAGAEVVDDVAFDVAAGEVLALVGESGCGKTSTAHALLGHARPGLRIVRGSVQLGGLDVVAAAEGERRTLRGTRISYVPQDPAAALNPRRRIGVQLRESLTVHGIAEEAAAARALDLVERVGLTATEEFLRRYPFELSGGQQQRVLIACAIACNPSVVVLDEPTTGLDVTTQARILKLLRGLSREHGLAFVYVTHDLAVVDEIADRVAVMYGGRIVELGPRQRVLREPAHPYAVGLLEAVPRLTERREIAGVPGMTVTPGDRPDGCAFHPRCKLATAACVESAPGPATLGAGWSARCWRAGELPVAPAASAAGAGEQTSATLLELRDLVATYQRSGPPTVKGVSLTVGRGECVALVGESGSGKSTIARCVAGLHEPIGGSIALDGHELAGRVQNRSRAQTHAIQIVFQNPDRSLNPSTCIGDAIGRALKLVDDVPRRELRARAAAMLERVHLPLNVLDAYPHQLSGGQKQRVAIARALAARPQLLVCDEVTSALDVSIQAAVVQLLEELRADGLAILFITHNLALVNSIAERTVVLAGGELKEQGPTAAVIGAPRDPYTRALVQAAPELGATPARASTGAM